MRPGHAEGRFLPQVRTQGLAALVVAVVLALAPTDTLAARDRTVKIRAGEVMDVRGRHDCEPVVTRNTPRSLTIECLAPQPPEPPRKG